MATRTSTTARGYGSEHQRLRAQWLPTVESGEAYCHAARCLMKTRWIPPGTPWDLGHTTFRTAWTGPEHPLCNRSEGGRRSHESQPLQRNRWVL